MHTIPADFEHCFGCSACASICPTKAIRMEEDVEGFLSPVMDEAKCINCKHCYAVCPAVHITQYPTPNNVMASWSSHAEDRKNSSSGGVFSLLARKILSEGGYVVGAVMENFYTFHTVTNDINDLQKIQGSKYVQSDMKDCFIKAKQLLDQDKKVIFTGTPCQIAGFRNFCRKEYKNLLTIDIICHGVPSPKVLRRYVQEIKQQYYTATSLTFRDKSPYWTTQYPISFYDDNGNVVFSEKSAHNVYLKGFIKNIYLRKSCSTCPYSSANRPGDISLGDFWKIEDFDPALNDKKGTSFCMLNSAKGEKAYAAISNDLSVNKSIPIDFAIATKGNLRRPSKESEFRAEFFDYIRNEDTSVIHWLEKKLFKVGVLNFHDSNNYGARLVPFALCRAINKLGYTSEVINFLGKKEIYHQTHEDFREKYLPRSKPKKSIDDLKRASPWWKRVVVGSDQVWKYRKTDIYMFNWVHSRTNLISYSASFGENKYSGNISEEKAKELLQRFDAISVREKSGVDICEKTFGVPAIQVIDPTMLLEREEYERLIRREKAKSPKSPYIGYLMLDGVHKKEIKNIVSKKDFSGYSLKNALWKGAAPRSIAEWLIVIKNSDFFITDSFHGTVFSILFEKKFAVLQAPNRGTERIPSLLDLFNIPRDRIYNNIMDITIDKISNDIDYTKVKYILQKEREKGFLFLKSALDKPVNLKKEIK